MEWVWYEQNERPQPISLRFIWIFLSVTVFVLCSFGMCNDRRTVGRLIIYCTTNEQQQWRETTLLSSPAVSFARRSGGTFFRAWKMCLWSLAAKFTFFRRGFFLVFSFIRGELVAKAVQKCIWWWSMEAEYIESVGIIGKLNVKLRDIRWGTSDEWSNSFN